MISFLSILIWIALVHSSLAASSTELSTMVIGTDGLKVIGKAGDRLGYTLSNAGDFNNDGYEDYILGAHQYDTATLTSAGMALVVLGGTYVSVSEIDLDTFASGSRGMRIIGGYASAAVGTTVAAAGDVNANGFDDVLVSSIASGSSTRHFFIIFGKAGPYTDQIITSTLTSGTFGFRILGPASIAGASNIRGTLGDVNGDGRDDFVVGFTGTTYSSRTGCGAVWIIYGKASTSAVAAVDLSSIGSAGIQISGATAGDGLGYSIAGVGDVNGDSIPDLVIGANAYDLPASPTAISNVGAVYLIYGSRTMTSIDLASFTTGSKGIRYFGAVASDALGFSTAGVGDINGDGLADFAMSAPGFDPKSAVFVIFGSSTVATADVSISSITAGSMGYAIFAKSSSSLYGYSISAAGDQNQDGVPDILVGHAATAAFLVYGVAAPTSHIYLLTATASQYWSFTAVATTGATSAIALMVDGGKDYNKDGIPDLLIGANQFDAVPAAGGTARTLAGAVFAKFGPHIPASSAPTAPPSLAPTRTPTAAPSAAPTAQPTLDGPTAEPTLTPTADPTATPTAQPSASPTADPTASPTAKPTANPSAAPTADPSAQPSAAPTETPTASPSAVPTTAAPTTDDSAAPSAPPTVKPTAAPTIDPTASPSAAPTIKPTAAPTIDPTANPSAAPTAKPTAAPTADPTASPSADPTATPTATPTADPTASPTASPTAKPTATPTANPTANPTASPTAAPTAAPTPSPTASPTLNPTADPSADPTAAPTASPTALPTADPSADPTAAPSAQPTFVPTAAPSAFPTARPTEEEQQDYVVTLVIEQTVYFMTAEDYFAEQVAYNLTIQHTVAASMDGVTPDQVTDIIVAETVTSEAQRRAGQPSSRAAADADSCFLSYTVSVHDPLLSFEELKEQVIEAATSGAMDESLHMYAEEFGATNLANGTFSVPRVRNAADTDDTSNLPSNAETTAMVIAITVGVCIIIAVVLYAKSKLSDMGKKDAPEKKQPPQASSNFVAVPTEAAAVDVYVSVEADEQA